MTDKEFNLLDENWVRVITPECEIKEVSLTDAIVHSHEYSGLCGELPTQDVAVMRLLLAVLHTVFSRVNEEGEPTPLEEPDEALERWKAIWDMGHIPENPVRDYLESQHEKFWLFHPERPFYQVPEKDFPKKEGKEEDKHGKPYSAKKLNGEIYESANKVRLFSQNGLGRNKLSYAEAARWIISLQAFDDVAVKYINDREKGKQGPGVGWLGKLGIITAKGNNLFETLMLNFVLLKDGNEIFAEEKPMWEQERANSKEEKEIPVPDNLAELYTLQTRRLLLLRNDEVVTEYYLCQGDYFESNNAFIEPMTIWKPKLSNTKDKSVLYYYPDTHDSSVQMWREFASTFPAQKSEYEHTPGVVKWISELQNAEFLDDNEMIKFCICSAEYGASNSSIADVFSDELSFHKKMLSEAECGWRIAITDEVAKCKEAANKVAVLAKEIDMAQRAKTKEQKNDDIGKEEDRQFYYRIDVPFRKWLESINSEWGTKESEADRKRWRETARKIAIALGEEMVANAGEYAFTGRMIKDDKSDNKKYYSSAKALLTFRSEVRKIYD